jgi:hypothetical protein
MTTAGRERFFLLIGSTWQREAATNKLRATGTPYKWKRLDSGPSNWESVLSILHEPSLAGVIGRLNNQVYESIASPHYKDIAAPLFQSMGNVAHVMYVHEAILTGEYPVEPEDYEDGSEEYWAAMERRYSFIPPSKEVRDTVAELFARYRINVVPYRTNAEVSVLASAFIDDHEKNLLFRVYVPSGRLYADEADRLLSLFQDWLNRVGRHHVRQGGYRTAAGEVYEFFGDPALASGQLTEEFDNFSGFLDLCMEDASAAIENLSRTGIDLRSAGSIVARFGKEGRRLQLDLRQQREARMLEIRHALESELVESSNEAVMPHINNLIDSFIPNPGNSAPMDLLALASPGQSSIAPAQITINQQYINKVQGTVISSIQGVANLNPEARDLLELVERFGGQDKVELRSAVLELEDEGARKDEKLLAKHRLRGFLIQLGGKVEDTALTLLQSYLQHKFGL